LTPEPTAIIIEQNFAHNLEQIIGETQIKTVILTSIGEMLGLKGAVVNFVIRKVKEDGAEIAGFSEDCLLPADAISQGKKFTIPKHESGPDDVIALQYTGGTPGVAKGAMLTNRNLVANMIQIRAWLNPLFADGASPVVLCPLPLYHIFSFTVNCLAFMEAGGSNVLIVNARDLPALIKEWKKYPVNLMTGVNTLYNGLLNHPDFRTIDFSTLRASVGGAMAVQRAVAERWQQVTGCQLTEGYGMTESSPVITVNPVDSTMRIGTIGVPMPSTDVRIVDDSGDPLPAGGDHIGEIQARGPQVMKGYWQRPEATAETIKDGWLCTGDIGFMHP
jgi:long-chain acyl-CoA synthetase